MASRRDFFRSIVQPGGLEGKAIGSSLHIRPPYALDESFFQSECPGCESKACAAACEESIIVIGGGGVPLLNFTKSGCTFCEACAEACEKGVLDQESGGLHINARVVIETGACMAHNGSICFSCKEPCLEDAILFKGLFDPVIDPDLCTGCGFCVSRCPTNAISWRAAKIVREAARTVSGTMECGRD